ncbi:aliphatic sulfonate ABC transporter substrate-binding protein [Paractinoplanes deccanensis]|uniref:Aliphatic sulfonate ABC transporter substrate-binding protein n=1 Tax=Paractinoplanes deccanensis TaxID=113561 RepID=A0ABQ3YLI6_9ACTN|nr:ABC transporter substrate-binding protein [Actinoplanes deccanensis]GID80867.1 aliphatic sulfonate ABC transporter substrate-binding protein [Actinoplanes deccanensis]
MRTWFTFGRSTAALGLVGALLLAGCSRPAAKADSATGATAKVRIAVGVDAAYAPFFLAKQEGLFDKAGLDVELTQTEGGPAITNAVVAGVAQLAANSDATIITLMAKSPDLRALAVFQESSQYLKVVWRKGITDVSQIKKMATAPGLMTLAAARYLQSKNIDRASVKFVNASAPDFPALLGNGDVDAYVVFEPWISKGVEQGGTIKESIGDYGMKYVQWIDADQKWLAANSAVAGKIVKVIAEACDIVAKDPQRAADATQKAVKIPAEQTLQNIGQIDFAVRDITGTDVSSAKSTGDFFVQEKLISAAPDLDQQLLKNWYSQNAPK